MNNDPNVQFEESDSNYNIHRSKSSRKGLTGFLIRKSGGKLSHTQANIILLVAVVVLVLIAFAIPALSSQDYESVPIPSEYDY